jgi:hypothetical protein
VRYLTPKTRKRHTDFEGGNPDDDPVDVMEDIREEEYEFPDGVPDDIMERIRRYEAEGPKGRPLREVLKEMGIEDENED